MCLPYPLPSHRPACGCQEGRSLTIPTLHACACLCTLSGPLFIQAPRFTRWYGWSSIKSDDEDDFTKRPRVAVTLWASAAEPRSMRFPSAGGLELGVKPPSASAKQPKSRPWNFRATLHLWSLSGTENQYQWKDQVPTLGQQFVAGQARVFVESRQPLP